MSDSQLKFKKEFKFFVLGLISTFIAYVLASWAIDSGSLVVYGLTILSTYFAIKFYSSFISLMFFKNDKTRSASKTKRKATSR